MVFVKEHRGSVLMSVLEIIIGVMLLVNPTGFTSGIIVAVGVVLTALGLWNIFRYFRETALEGMRNRGLALGLGLMVVGCFFIFRSSGLIVTFPALTILYGVAILFSGLYKVQVAVDMLRLRVGNSVVAAISAVMTLVFACVILANPFATTGVLWMFIGIVLIVEAVLDLLSIFVGRGRM